MRMLSWVKAAILAVAWSVPASALTINWDAAPREMPSVIVEGRGGDDVELMGDLAGRVVVLNLWATWCAPCKREMPTLAALQDAFDRTDLEVVALAVDRAPFSALDAFMADVGAGALTVVKSADMAAARALGAPGLPVTIVVDREGRERFRHAGYADWATDETLAALAALAAE